MCAAILLRRRFGLLRGIQTSGRRIALRRRTSEWLMINPLPTTATTSNNDNNDTKIESFHFISHKLQLHSPRPIVVYSLSDNEDDDDVLLTNMTIFFFFFPEALHQRQVHNRTREHNTGLFTKLAGFPAPNRTRRRSHPRLAAVFVSERHDTEVGATTIRKSSKDAIGMAGLKETHAQPTTCWHDLEKALFCQNDNSALAHTVWLIIIQWNSESLTDILW